MAKIIAIGDKYQAEALESASRLRHALEAMEALGSGNRALPPRPAPEAPLPRARGQDGLRPRRGSSVVDPLIQRLHAAIEEGGEGRLAPFAVNDVSLLLRRYEKTDARLEKIVTISDGYQSQLREATTRMDYLARTDPLTGLPNRRDMMERLAREVARFDRYGTLFSLILFDIDDFKLVNDRYGHETGDKVLRNVASIFGRELRKSDTCARWGGEEFLVLCPETGTVEAVIVGEKCRKAIAESAVEARECRIGVTVSGGVSAIAAGFDIDALIRGADDSLYRAKDAGKNLIRGCEA